MSDEPDANNSSVFEESDATSQQMSEDIEDIIRDMNEAEIARIRNGYTDPMFEKGAKIDGYKDQTWVIVDFDRWNDGKLKYVMRPVGEDWVESHPQDLVDMVAREVSNNE